MRFGFRELVFLMVLLAVPVASLFYVFKHRNEEIRHAKTEIDDKKQRLAQLERVSAELEDIGLEIEKGREAIRDLENQLPPAQDVEGILEQVWHIATGHALTVKSVKTEKSVSEAGYGEQPLRMIVEGDFDGFYEFLLELETLPRITRMHDLEIQRASSTSKTPHLGPDAMTAEFVLSIYYVPNA
jgi:Tfp pilus assembly protein PilO